MLKIKNISKHYGKNKILENISFEIDKGECIGIIGANGSGKTTLLSIICGINKADSGEILIDDNVISTSSKNISKYISYVPQENPLIPELSSYDNIRLWYSGSKKDLKNELENGILNSLGINEFADKTVSKLSGGMKKRLSIGIALLQKPELLIMDEPSASLDISTKFQIKEYMKYFTSKLNCSVLVVSHDHNELSVCDKLYLLKNGKLSLISSSLTEEELSKII